MTTFSGRGFSCKRVVENGAAVLAVYHERDGDWQLLCGGDEHGDETQIVVIHPSHLIEKDKTLRRIADLPRGFMATRSAVGSVWTRAMTEASEDNDVSEELTPREEIEVYKAMVTENPDDPAIWFDLGLACKRARDWSGCIDANEHALDLKSDLEDPAWWNLGIAATAVRDWGLARKAWRGYGLEIPEGEGPIACDWGWAPVRLPNNEIVWGPRLDPARVILRSIPFAESGYRWGDIVLHDGAPNGEREIDGKVYSVFDVFEKWSPSEIPTLAVEVHCASEEDARALTEPFESRGFGAEDWTTNVRPLCKACSEGRPSGHSHPFANGGPDRSFGVASPMGLAVELLNQWEAASPTTRRFSPPVPVA
jgi:hypothetical protein